MFSLGIRKAIIVRKTLSETENCVFVDPTNSDNVICTLGAPVRDDAVNLLCTAIEVMDSGHATGNISFVSLPTKEYTEWLQSRKTKRDTYLNREAYLFASGSEAHMADAIEEWEKQKREKTDISFLVAFSVDLPELQDGQECTTKYRLSKEACGFIADTIRVMYAEDGVEVYVSREVIHWGDYYQDQERYYNSGVSKLNGEGCYYLGTDLEQRYGGATDARYIAPILCLPVVVRRPMPRIMSKDMASAYLSNSIVYFSQEEATRVCEALQSSGICPKALFDMLLPPTILQQQLEDIFQEKGMKYSVCGQDNVSGVQQ